METNRRNSSFHCCRTAVEEIGATAGPCCFKLLSHTLAPFLCQTVIAEAVEKWKMEREARLARGDDEEEEEENIYAVNEDEVCDG